MIKHKSLEHVFVDSFPTKLEPGKLYVSMEYGSVAHSCCCGCGEEIVTPLTPTDWHITYDGETITLNPSVGNWTLPCRSHYVIRKGKAIAAPSWSEEQVAAERRRDSKAKAAYFGTDTVAPSSLPPFTRSDISYKSKMTVQPSAGWWIRLRLWWNGFVR